MPPNLSSATSCSSTCNRRRRAAPSPQPEPFARGATSARAAVPVDVGARCPYQEESSLHEKPSLIPTTLPGLTLACSLPCVTRSVRRAAKRCFLHVGVRMCFGRWAHFLRPGVGTPS
eukprot:365707-Chlamydomonas_euryale.AAC.32